MKRVALLCSEPIRAAMGGIGIRYLELARRLPGTGLDVVLLSPGDPADAPNVPAEVLRLDPAKLREQLHDCDCVVAQGHQANAIASALPDTPTVLDLYDPFLVENLQYFETLGLEPYQRDLATWWHQFTHGDFFLCSSEEQRTYYLGFLTAAGRVNPKVLQTDRDLRRLIDVVPFGVDDQLPPHQPVLPQRHPGEKRILFGGLYDWYDPWVLLESLEQLDRPDYTVIFVRNPNPASTPQKLMEAVEAWGQTRGWLGERMFVHDWVPSDRRFDLLRDADVLVSPHKRTLETHLSLRTRFIDALAAGCPVIMTEGGAMSRMVEEAHAGYVVAEGDKQALTEALLAIIEDQDEADRCRSQAGELARQFHWDRVLEPLVSYCRNPWIDETKREFARHQAVQPHEKKPRRSWFGR